MTLRSLLPPSLAFAALLLSGCHAPSLPTPAREQPVAQQQAELATQQAQLSLIPPPSKSRYMAIRTIESWDNPYLTVQPDMITLHVLRADSNTSPLGAGGMLRPMGARRESITLRPEKLDEAVTAIPQSAWPYGRVLAIEEARGMPKSAEIASRRAVEAAVNKLNTLGVVVYDPAEGSLR